MCSSSCRKYQQNSGRALSEKRPAAYVKRKVVAERYAGDIERLYGTPITEGESRTRPKSRVPRASDASA